MSYHELTHPSAARNEQSSVFRYWLLLALAVVVGAPPAYIAWTNLDVSYTANGSLWIEGTSRPGPNDVAAIQAGGLESSAWIELLRSYRVLEPVVMEHKLYVRAPEQYARAFASFTLAEQFAPGTYELRVGDSSDDFVLVTRKGELVQQGLFGTPIGANVGFSWTPSPGSFAPGARIEFSVLIPRDAAQDLSDDLVTAMERSGNFLRVELRGPDPQRVVHVLNSLMQRHVDIAAELKNRKLDETLGVLKEQLDMMELELAQAERDLARFRLRAAATEGQEIAPRSTDEERLRRRVRTAESIYIEIRVRVETARLAVASSIPDVRILDRASVSPRTSQSLGLPIAAAILFGCIGAAAGGAVLLGRRDARSHGSTDEVAMRSFGDDLVPTLAIVGGCALAVLATGLLMAL